MEKIILVLTLSLLLIGCGLTPVKPEEGVQAVYKRYDIVMPERPELNSDKLGQSSTPGQVARAYELDLINITEYALKLENLLAPIVESESGYDVEPKK